MPIPLVNIPNTNQMVFRHPAQYLAAVRQSDVKGTIKALWEMPYDADPILEPELVGLTQGQVVLSMQIKAAMRGEGGATDRLLDRFIGKPEQINKNLNLGGSYKDFLEEVARQEGIIDVEGNVIDVEATSVDADQSPF